MRACVDPPQLHIDLDAGTLRVGRAWDHGALEFVAPKSEAGMRTVPIAKRLALILADRRVLTGSCSEAAAPSVRSQFRRWSSASRGAGATPS